MSVSALCGVVGCSVYVASPHGGILKEGGQSWVPISGKHFYSFFSALFFSYFIRRNVSGSQQLMLENIKGQPETDPSIIHIMWGL